MAAGRHKLRSVGLNIPSRVYGLASYGDRETGREKDGERARERSSRQKQSRTLLQNGPQALPRAHIPIWSNLRFPSAQIENIRPRPSFIPLPPRRCLPVPRRLSFATREFRFDCRPVSSIAVCGVAPVPVRAVTLRLDRPFSFTGSVQTSDYPPSPILFFFISSRSVFKVTTKIPLLPVFLTDLIQTSRRSCL